MTNDMLVKCILKDGELDIKTTVRAQFTKKKKQQRIRSECTNIKSLENLQKGTCSFYFILV